MVKLLLLFLVFFNFANATLVQEKIKKYIGPKNYAIQVNLLNILFSDEKQYLKEDGSTNDIRILTKLKQSGLLKLFYDSPKNLDIVFFTKNDPLIFMRVINEILSSMGYTYYLSKQVLKDTSGFTWEIVLSTEHVIDPTYFSSKLEELGSFIVSIDKASATKWRYVINSDKIQIKSIRVEANSTTKLKKPIKPYWIYVQDMKSISIRAYLADRWHPNVIFYDDKLHIIKDYTNEEIATKLKLSVPIGARYVKITDIYNLDNIKRGISIYLIAKN